MPYSNIDKPSKYFNTLTYTGDASSPRTVTGVGFKPDFTWIKNRTRAGSSALNDNVRGAGLNKELSSETNSLEGSNGGSGYGYISAFASDGFTLTTGSTAYDIVNRSGDSYVSWNWLGSGTTPVSNTAGTRTSTVSANTTSGFSIVSYTGNQVAGATVGHGLGVKPALIIVKLRSGDVGEPFVYHKSLGATKAFKWNTSDAPITNTTVWNDTEPTSTVFSVGTSNNVNHVYPLIAYCFAEVKGFSKFGSYTGNGSSDGTFIYTGFKPAWIMIKQSSTSGEGWEIADNKRSTNNVITTFLRNSSGTESTNTDRQFDFLSNGIKMRGTHGSTNGSGSTYIYMAFAENPFVSSKGIPTTAR
jgi:hypothetical protein